MIKAKEIINYLSAIEESIIDVGLIGKASVKNIVLNYLNKIELLAKKQEIELETDLIDLRKNLLREIDSMKKEVNGTDNFKLTYLTRKLKKSNEDFDKFKSDFYLILLDLINSLRKYKGVYGWVDILKIVEPLTKIEYKEKERDHESKEH